MKIGELYPYAEVLMSSCFALKAGEKVAILTDAYQPLSIAESIMAACRSMGAEPTLIVYPPVKVPALANATAGLALPKIVTEGAKAADVIFMYGNWLLIGALRSAGATNARIGSLLGDYRQDPSTRSKEVEGTFIRALSVDFHEVSGRTQDFTRRFSAAKEGHFFTEAGTDLHFKLGNQFDCHDGVIHKPGVGEWIPFGVVAGSPIHGSGNGIVMLDLAIDPIGSVNRPIKLTIKDNIIVSIEGDAEAERLRKHLESFKDPSMFNCPAEVGVGTNPNARQGTFPWEEERIFGSGHVAIGDAFRFDGQKFKAPAHLDAIFKDASLELDGKLVMERGRFL